MSSRMCEVPMLASGEIDINDPRIVDDLIDEYIKTQPSPIFSCRPMVEERRGSCHRPQSTPSTRMRKQCYFHYPSSSTSWSGTNMDADSLIHHTLTFQDWLSKKQVKVVQEKADLEAKSTRKLYTDLLQREATLVKDLDAILAQKEELDLRRKELLHKKWSDNVYEPIRREINREMDGPGYLELMQRKCQQHKEFLELINRKGHVFLDTIDPEEYYAMSLYPNKNAALVAKTKALQDPLLIQERELTQEDRVVHQCTTGSVLSDRELNDVRLPRFPLMPLMPLGRHGTGCRQWIDMPLANIESTVRKASRCRFKSKPKAPQTDIMHWSSEDQQPKKVVLAQYLAGDQRRSNRLIVDNCGGQDLGGNEAGGSLSVY